MSIYEHDFEPTRGLPGMLPKGERVLWQGSPQWRAVLVHVLHVRWVAAYFGAIVAWRFAANLGDGLTLGAATTSALWLTPLWATVIGAMALYAWGVARTTVYTITSKRLVIRQGVAIEMAVNVPFSQVASAQVCTFADGTGQIPLGLESEIRLAYLVIWPHAQFGHYLNPKPMLRGIAEPARVGAILAQALTACTKDAAPVTVTTATDRAAPSRPLAPLSTAA
jgi:Bacterial PH domain